jgi:histidine triad (HIT) family protein
MPSIFTRIVNGEIPCYKVAEDDRFLAFLDISPLAKGHALVIPKQEIDYIFGIEDKLYQDLFLFAKRVALAIEKVVPCQKMGIAVLGLEVAHAHIHLVPVNTVYDIDFSKQKMQFTREEFLELADKIGAEYKKLV